MTNLLLGNGIDIQFGGDACTSRYIIKRIKYKALQDGYDELFDYTVSSTELIDILNGFVIETNSIIDDNYDIYAKDDNELSQALEEFKGRYKEHINSPEDIMLEDWLFIVRMFFVKNIDLERNREAAIQGFERLLLDAIYNDGLVQKIYKNMNKKIKKYLYSFDKIFTLNYDNNIELLTGKEVLHLHGDFSVLADSENADSVVGFIRNKNKETVLQEEFRHCYCNALLNYSGKLKRKRIEECEKANKALEKLYIECMADNNKLEELQRINKDVYLQVKTKIEHPELKATSDYHFNEFCSMEGELCIIGMSPNNDAHIFDAILENDKIKKVKFYYLDLKQKEYIEKNFPKELFVCEDVNSLWDKLLCSKPQYNCNYHFPAEIDQFVKIFNELSMDEVSVAQAEEAIKQITRDDMKRLCGLVKADIKKRSPKHEIKSEEEFKKENASISYIALQQGILPTVLYLICIMNFELIMD